MASIRLLDVLWQAATAAVVVVIGARVFRRAGVGLVAGGFYAPWHSGSDYWTTAQTDGFLTLPVALEHGLSCRREGTGR